MGCRKLSYHEKAWAAFSTLPENYAVTETFESGEENGFQDLHRVTNAAANTTPGGNEVCLLRSGETGAMLFLSLDKGDTINLEVKANYAGAPSGTSFLGTVHGALFGAFDAVYGSGTEGGVAGSSGEFGDALSGAGMSGKDEAGEAPRAFLNYIIFDGEMDYVRAGFRQIGTAAQGLGAHETVSLTGIIAGREGYLLAYLSNENKEAVDVHFDDFTVYHGKTNVVSSQDYYPFGLAFNERRRTASAPQNYKFNGFEEQRETGNYMAFYRDYDPVLGRWNQIDPKANDFFSPYSGFQNNPLLYTDLLGDTVKFAGQSEERAYNNYKKQINSRVQAYDKKTQNLREKGKTEKADKRDANRSSNAYVKIQGELNVAESDVTVFRVRMGDNISNSAGGGNVSYNPDTGEIDVNIGDTGDWSTTQRMAHEFKHVDQFINGELDFYSRGRYGGLFYDKTDEIAAFRRQNLFGAVKVDPVSFVNRHYPNVPNGPKSFHLLSETEKEQYKSGSRYIFHGKK